MEKILYSLSFIPLIAGIIWLSIIRILGGRTSKDYFRTAKLAVIISIFFSVIFYNKGIFPTYFSTTIYTTMFFALCGLIAFIWLSLSYRWFTSLDIPSYSFCSLALWAVLICKIILMTTNFGILFIGLAGLALINYLFLRFSQENEEFHRVSSHYGRISIFFGLLMFIGLMLLTPFNWDYQLAAEYLQEISEYETLIIIIGLLCFLIFMLGIAPFHFGFTDIIAPAVLPVAAYFSLVPFLALWSAFIKINTVLLHNFEDERLHLYTTLGIISLIIGAVGAHTSRNLKKIFGYVGLYNIGVILIIMAQFTTDALLNSLIYMQAYLLAILGIYTCFYSFKSSREYLNNLSMINGIASVRKYISIAVLLLIFSLIGIAPLPGFIGQLTAVNFLIEQNHYIPVLLILGSMFILSPALIRVISVVFFAPQQNDYDRPDKGIYLYLIIVAVLFAFIIYRPQLLTDNALIILEATGN